MISNDTKQSVPATGLAQRGTLTHISGDSYHHKASANAATGVGPIGTYWTAEPGESVPVQGPAGA